MGQTEYMRVYWKIDEDAIMHRKMEKSRYGTIRDDFGKHRRHCARLGAVRLASQKVHHICTEDLSDSRARH